MNSLQVTAHIDRLRAQVGELTEGLLGLYETPGVPPAQVQGIESLLHSTLAEIERYEGILMTYDFDEGDADDDNADDDDA